MATTVELTPDRVLHRLEWQVIRRLDGRLQGNYRTLLRGVGTDFRDVRDYESGDDVRHIDWNVTARMDSLFVRQYSEDRELTAWLLLDRSPSMSFGPVDRPKELVMCELAATVARLLTRGGNRVGAILYDNAIEQTLPPRSGRNQVLALTRELMRPATGTGRVTALDGLLDNALGIIRRRSLVVLVSDFITEPGWERSLMRLTERHEVIAIRLVDPREFDLPDAGVIVVEDAETGEQLVVDSSDPELRRRLREAGEAREAELRVATARAGVALHEISTEEDLAGALIRLVEFAEAAALMSFASPSLLVLLVAIPAIIAAYVAMVRRRARRAAELAAQALVLTANAARVGKKRHIPFALFTIALAVLVVAVARPRTDLTTPHREGTVVLAFDVSNSMRATDLEPTRLDAAKDAARAFVVEQPATVRIGVVAFGDGSAIALQPTTTQADVLAAIDRLAVAGGTSLGQGLYASLNAIAGKPIVIDEAALESDTAEVDIGYFGSSQVILLSDGENTGEPDPLTVAEIASVAGVKVHTIGIGTTDGTTVDIEGFKVATALDRDLLEEIATVSDGTYFEATDADSLAEIYTSIDLEIVTTTEHTEVTALFTMAGSALLVIGALLSVLWFGRVV